jgi:hypothetical protein
VTAHHCDSDSGTPSGCVADLQLVSITPSETTAKVGDDVSFTITTLNAGPDTVEVWVAASPAATIDCPDGSTGESCVELAGVLGAGQSRTVTAVQMVSPTSTGALSETACAWSPELQSKQVCKTATIAVSGQTCTGGMPGATQTFDNHTYTLEGEDTFTKNAPLGSFAQPTAAGLDANLLPVVYTGDHGMGWTEYADGWPSTNSDGQPGYAPSTVQSVHDGVLDFTLHDGLGASISPLPAGHRYQTYGAWSFCERVPRDGGLPPDNGYANYDGWLYGYHQAPLLWPDDDSDFTSAESDFPESDLANGTPDFAAYAHHAGSTPQDVFAIDAALPAYDPSQWHVYTQTWGPGFRSYYVDGQLVGTSTTNVWSQPERWQLQLEPSVPNRNPAFTPGYGDVYVKWVWIGTWQ